MKKNLPLNITLQLLFFIILSCKLSAQTLEWRLVNPTYSAVDPDGAGAATGSATFTLQMHAVSTAVNNINTISVGWSYQSAKAMIPTTPGCTIVSSPANIIVSPTFIAAGFAYTTVNQCGAFTQTAGGQQFDQRSVGTLDGNAINFTTTWVDVFTVTLWSKTTVGPQAGYVCINSGSGGSPAPFPTYAAADITANEYVVNSLTYATPLALGSGSLPVTLSRFNAKCTLKGASLTWQTLTEDNSSYFNIEKSANGVSWSTIGILTAAGNSATERNYEYIDAQNAANSFYRLKQVDKDGKFTFSSVARLNCPEEQNIFVYPVPAKNILNVSLTIQNGGQANIKILDAAGKLYLSRAATFARGNNQLKMDVSRLSAGQYILTIEQKEMVQTRKFSISR